MRHLPISAVALFVLFTGLQSGCERRDDLDGRRRAIPGLAPKAISAEQGELVNKELAFDFVDNRAAALVVSDGALVASGRGVAFALLSRGGGPAQWKLGEGAHPSARVAGQVAHIHFPYDKDPGGIEVETSVPVSLRFRPSSRGQLASVFLNDTKVGDISMNETGTAEYRIDVPSELLVVGENDLRLFFRHAPIADGLRSAGALERIAIGNAEISATASVRAITVERGDARIQSLSAQSRARISYYLVVPEARPRLVFQHAGQGSAAIRIKRAGEASRELWRGKNEETFSPVTLDLADVAGELVRIDLTSDGACDWGKPQVWAERDETPEAPVTAAASHVVVWIVGAMREDFADAKTMPTLHALAMSGTRRVAISRRPSASLAAADVLTGRSIEAPPIAASVETLAEKFRSAGYKTALYSNAPTIPGDHQGFDRVVRSALLGASDLWSRAQTDLKSNADVRTLSVIWAGDPSLPWTPEAAVLEPEWRSYSGTVNPRATKQLSAQSRAGLAIAERDRDYLKALYRGELATVDGALATMAADIETLGIAKDTGVIIVGDRGQALFEEGSFGEPLGLAASEIAVPLVVVTPAGLKVPATAELAVTADAYATALDLAQISAPLATQGKSVFSRSTGRTLLIGNPGRAQGVAFGDSVWFEGRENKATLIRGFPDGKPTPASRDLVTSRAMINWMSLLVATGEWDARRWGAVNAMRAAFATEHGGL